MSTWHRASSIVALASLAGAALSQGGCSLVYDFAYGDPIGAGGAGSSSSSSSGSASSSSGGGAGGGGACEPTDATCGIEVVASDGLAVATYGDVAVSGMYVYWAGDNSLQVQEKMPNVARLPSPTGALGIQLVAGATEGEIVCTDLAGSIYAISADVKGFSELTKSKPTGLAVKGGYVYWPSSSGSSFIQKMKSGDAGPTQLDMAGTNPSAIAAGPGMDEVYWSFQGVSDKDGGIRGLTPIGDFEVGQNRPSGIAVDMSAVYWITGDGIVHKKVKMPPNTVTSSSAVEPYPNASFPSGKIVVAGAHVYWLGPDSVTCDKAVCDCGSDCGAVLVAPTSDLSQRKLFAKAAWGRLYGLATDGTHVYWTATSASAHELLRKSVLP